MSGPTKRILASVLAWVWLGGCGALAPKADPSNFYVLVALAKRDLAADNIAALSNANLSVGLGPIELPSYLDRQQIATRTSTHRLSYSETDRWAAPMADSFSRVIGENLSRMLNSAQVSLFPWQSNNAPDYQVRIEVLQFESDMNQEAWLVARWAVFDRNTKILLNRTSQRHRRAGSSASEDSVRALSELLGDLSLEIAKVLLAFNKQGNTLP